MMHRLFVLVLLVVLSLSCDPNRGPVGGAVASDADLSVAGSLQATMMEGRLGPALRLDTLADRDGLYGLGPADQLTGEVTIYDGKCYVSRVGPDGELLTEERYAVGPPFFVYTHQRSWNEYTLPATVRNLDQLEHYIDEVSIGTPRPFAFRLVGPAEGARVHVMNVPVGFIPESPGQAHRYQQSYELTEREVDVIGFFSTSHQGVFTHHDSYVHLHLLTRDRQMMGHLDALRPGEGMKLFLSE